VRIGRIRAHPVTELAAGMGCPGERCTAGSAGMNATVSWAGCEMIVLGPVSVPIFPGRDR